MPGAEAMMAELGSADIRLFSAESLGAAAALTVH